MKIIPANITTKEALQLAEPGEAFAVRVILTRVSNGGNARHKCRHRTYIFERDGAIGAHTLTIPASLWMQGTPRGAYRDNPSISHDLQPTLANGLVVQVIPFPGTVAAPAAPVVVSAPGNPEEPTKLALIDKLLSKLNAPGIMREALVAAMEGSAAELAAFVDSVEVVEYTDTPETDEQEMNDELPSNAGESPGGFCIVGKEIFMFGEKVAIFVEPDNTLRMSKGKTALREEVEAFLATNAPKPAEAESLV